MYILLFIIHIFFVLELLKDCFLQLIVVSTNIIVYTTAINIDFEMVVWLLCSSLQLTKQMVFRLWIYLNLNKMQNLNVNKVSDYKD